MPLDKRILAARIRADLAEKRITRRTLAAFVERSVKTAERWTSGTPENEGFRPTRAEALVIAYLTGYPLSRYTGDETDDVVFPLSPAIADLRARLDAAGAQRRDAGVVNEETVSR